MNGKTYNIEIEVRKKNNHKNECECKHKHTKDISGRILHNMLGE